MNRFTKWTVFLLVFSLFVSASCPGIHAETPEETIARLEKEISVLSEANKLLTEAVKALKEANDTLKEVIVLLKEGSVETKSGDTESTEQEELSVKEGTDPVKGVYSTGELKKISALPLEEAREKISTVEDAAHYLGLFGYTYYSGTSPTEANFSLSHAQTKLKGKAIADNTSAALVAYLLSDDYKEMGYITAPLKQNNGSMRAMAGLYILHDDTYYVASVSQKMVDLGYIKPGGYTMFDTMTVKKLTEVRDKLQLNNIGKGTSPVQILTASYQEDLIFACGKDTLTVKKGKAEEIFRISDAEIKKASEKAKKEQLTTLADNLKKQKYTSKGLTITADEAMKLVGSGLKNVQKTCQSLEDVLLFLCATDSRQSSGDIQTKDSSQNYTWHFNYSPQMVYEMNTSNCGGTASYVAYLLEDDYDEVGMLTMRAENGGHVINYFHDGSMWFSVDVNSYHGNNFSLNSLGYNAGGDLITVGQRAAQRYSSPYKSSFATPHLSSDPTEGDVPVGWDSTKLVRIPMEYKESVTIIFETAEEGFTFEFVDVADTTWKKIDALRNG